MQAQEAEETKEELTLWEALTQGDAKFSVRGRLELANQEGLAHSEAWTVRTWLGYATKSAHGLSGFVQFEDVRAVRDDLFNAAGLNGQGRRTVVADPEDTELNQAYLAYDLDSMDTRFVLGRQQIVFDDSRFIGDVVWRQNQQTYDAFRVTTHPLPELELTYAYLWDVNRIFGHDSNRDFESDSHLVHLNYDLPGNLGKFVAFGYFLRIPNSKVTSSDTYGFRWTGSRPLDDDESFSLAHELSYAYQKDGRSSPLSYSTHYFHASATVDFEKKIAFGAGWEELGSDSGRIGFATPLATAHKFNGWADAFLITPTTGLEDAYFFVSGKLPGNINGKLIYHRFQEEHGGHRLGGEYNWIMTKKINNNWSVLSKFAYFDGSTSRGLADRVRWWLQTTVRF